MTLHTLQSILARTTRTEAGCLEWQGASNQGGKVVRVHRLVFELASGEPITNGLHVLHSRDNPPCLNPEHLSLGTPLENARQREQRGRGSRAASAWRAA